MDSAGVIEKQVSIGGLDRINDMESITQDEWGVIYILTSQSKNKKGLLPESRKLFVRIRRAGETLTLDGRISLADRLIEAARRSPRETWAAFLTQAGEQGSLEIEGMYCDGGKICFGFKNPLVHDSIVVMALNNVDSVFKNDTIREQDLSICEKILLKASGNDVAFRITDMCHQAGNIYLVSTATLKLNGGKQHQGLFAVYNPLNRRLTALKHFYDSRPEGITYDDGNGSFCITFDNGARRPSQIMMVKVQL
jgi:hypothetical protein